MSSIKTKRLLKERAIIRKTIQPQVPMSRRHSMGDNMWLELEAEMFSHTQPYDITRTINHEEIVEVEVPLMQPIKLIDWFNHFINYIFSTDLKVNRMKVIYKTKVLLKCQIQMVGKAHQLFPNIATIEGEDSYFYVEPEVERIVKSEYEVKDDGIPPRTSML